MEMNSPLSSVQHRLVLDDVHRACPAVMPQHLLRGY
jgi:hypothetical protein